MMKYILVIVFLMHAVGACGMNADSKAKRLQVLRDMGADNRVANRNMETLMPADVRDEERVLVLNRMHRALKKQKDEFMQLLADQDEETKREHQELQARIVKQNQDQIDRLVFVVEKQTGTISNLNGFIQAILKKTYKTEMNVASQGQEISEMKQVTSEHVGSLLEAVGDQTELIKRQTKIISQLTKRVEDLGQTLGSLQTMLSRLQKTMSRHEERLQNHDRLHVKARHMLMAVTAVFTNQELDNVIKMLEEPDMPVVESDESDPELERKILGSGSEIVSLGDDPEAIAQYNSQLVSQEKINEESLADLEEGGVPADDEKLQAEQGDGKQLANEWELVEEYIEDIVPAKDKDEASGGE